MIRIRFKERLADKAYREGRIVTMQEVADATGVHRMTLSKVANHRDHNPRVELLDRLCKYFGCSLSDLAEFVPDEVVPKPEKAPVPVKRQAVKNRGNRKTQK